MQTKPQVQTATTTAKAGSQPQEFWELVFIGKQKPGQPTTGYPGVKFSGAYWAFTSRVNAAVALPPLTSISWVTAPAFMWNASTVYLPSGKSPLKV